MTTKTLSTLLVASFRFVPGQQLLAVLAKGAELLLVPEPDNPYDSHAVKVLWTSNELTAAQHRELNDRLEGTGWTAQEVLDFEEPIMLGYLAATNGKPLIRLGLSIGNKELLAATKPADCEPWLASLSFHPSGHPMVTCQLLASAEGDGQ